MRRASNGRLQTYGAAGEGGAKGSGVRPALKICQMSDCGSAPVILSHAPQQANTRWHPTVALHVQEHPTSCQAPHIGKRWAVSKPPCY